MKRSVLGLDRVVIVLVGLLVLAVGLVAVAWGAGLLPRVWDRSPDELTLATATDAFAASWWPGASLAAGVVLGLLALWWVLAHRTHRSTGPLRLAGSTPSDPRRVDGSAAAATAADVVARTPGVRSARGKVVADRGRLVADLDVTVEPEADLGVVAAAADRVMGELAQVLGRDDVTARVHLDVARSSRGPRRQLA